MTDPAVIYTTRNVISTAYDAEAEKRADAREAKGWKHTADFMNQVANTTISLGFLAPLATWAFGVAGNPLSTGLNAFMIALLWLITGVIIHLFAGSIVRSFDL